MPQPKHIVKIQLPNPEDLDAETIKYFQICEEKLGFVPNVLRAYTNNLEKLRAFTTFYNQLMLDEKVCTLSILEREMIAVVVSSANRCYYCLVAHGQAIRQISKDPQLGEMLVMNYKVAELDPKTMTMLDFAWKLTKFPQNVTEDDKKIILDLGFSEKDYFDICDTVAFFNYTNRIAHGLNMMPNEEYHNKDRCCRQSWLN